MQHFQNVEHMGGETGHATCVRHDLLKERVAEEKQFSLLRVGYWQLGRCEAMVRRAVEQLRTGGAKVLRHHRQAYLEEERRERER